MAEVSDFRITIFFYKKVIEKYCAPYVDEVKVDIILLLLLPINLILTYRIIS